MNSLSLVGAQTTIGTPGDVVSSLLMVLLGVLIYFIPSFVASGRHHHNAGAIFAVNLLAGWTAIGWLVALIWALMSPPPVPAPPVNVYTPDPEYLAYLAFREMQRSQAAGRVSLTDGGPDWGEEDEIERSRRLT